LILHRLGGFDGATSVPTIVRGDKKQEIAVSDLDFGKW
jgi:hypothetical protein